MKRYSLKVQKKDIHAWQMLLLFILSVYAQDTYSMYLYYVIVLVLTISNAISFFTTKSYSRSIWTCIFFVMALGVTTISFIVSRISWMEEMKAICYVLILIGTLFIYRHMLEVYEKGMRMISCFIVLSAIYGIIEAVISYNFFEKFFVADYIRGYYGTELYRIASVYMHPIVCGQVLLIGFWMVAFFYNGWKRNLYMTVIAVGIYYTKSRSIWGGLAFSIAFYGLVKLIGFLKIHKVQRKKLLYIPLALGCVGLLYKAGVFDSVIEGIYDRIKVASGSTSQLARQSMSLYTVNYMIHDSSWLQKLFGYGMESSKQWIYKSGAFVKAYDAIDNSYLTIIYEFGLIGVIAILALIIDCIVKAFSKMASFSALSKASTMAILACIIPLYFYDFYGWLPVYTLFIYCTVSCSPKIDFSTSFNSQIESSY